MRNLKSEYSIIFDYVLLNVLKVLTKFILFRKIFEVTRFGHNQNIDVAYGEDEVFVLPPLSGSSSGIKILKMRGYKISQVKLTNLYNMTYKYDKINFIERADCDRLKSFYTKKILNNNTLKKFILFLGYRNFFHVNRFDDYLDVLIETKTLKNIKRDKHLLLNDDILLNLNSQKVKKINMSDFLSHSVKLNTTSQLAFCEKITKQQIARLDQFITEHKKQTKDLVDIIFISSRKAGSTYVDEKLRLNRKISLPTNIKEINFYSRNFQKGIEWYRKQFKRVDRAVFVDVCPTYGSDCLALQRIYKINPNATVVMLARDPLKRAISHYRHIIKNRLLRPDKPVIPYFPEILFDSEYSVIHKNLLEAGFKSNKIKLINVDDRTQFDFQIEALFSKEIRNGFLPKHVVVNRNISFQVRYKFIYLLLRKLNFNLNKIGVRFPHEFKSKLLHTFKSKETIGDRAEFALQEYAELFEREREFLKNYSDKNEVVSVREKNENT